MIKSKTDNGFIVNPEIVGPSGMEMTSKTVRARLSFDDSSTREAVMKKLEKLASMHEAQFKVIRYQQKEPKGTPNGKGLVMLKALSNAPELSNKAGASHLRTQPGIAEVVGVDVSVVSRYLSILKKNRLIRATTAPIQDNGRRMKAYYLTDAGHKVLKTLE